MTLSTATHSETLTIDRLVYGGEGLARLASGEVVFVPGALPGETVSIELTALNAKKKAVRLQEIVTPSESRVTAECPVFNRCGGCHWQHLAIDQQRVWKQAIVEESFRRIGKFADVSVLPILVGDKAVGYRNRLTWNIHRPPTGLTLAYYEEGSHTMVSGVPCLLASKETNALAEALKPLLANFPKLERLQLMETTEGQRLVVLLGSLDGTPSDLNWADAFSWQAHGVVGVINLLGQSATLLWGQETLTQSIGQKPFQISAGSFFQVNAQMAEALAQAVIAAIPQGASHVLDLYAGGGLFGLLAAPNAQAVTLVESGQTAIADAKANIATQQLSNVSVMQGDVSLMGTKLPKFPSVGIVDPPRKGLSKTVLSWLMNNVTDRLIYVSCDPTTLARDARQWVDGGWQLDWVQPVDMFPQTYHVETMAVFSKAKQTS